MSKVKYVSQETHDELCKRVKPRNRDILLCRIGTLGKPIIVNVDYEFSIFVSLGLLRLIDERLAEWVVTCIDAPIGFQWIQRVKVGGGTHTFKINLGDIPNFLIPLPPYEEQLRIRENLSAILDHVGDYEELKGARERLDAELPDRLRKSILQLAVQGKLVEQDPADEPASVLLERIRAERTSLVKAKKLKTPKGGESVIYRASDGGYYEKLGKGDPICIDDEIPFEIPENWEWARFTWAVPVSYGFPADSSLFSETGAIGLIRIRDVNSGDLIHTETRYDGDYDQRYVVHSGDDLIGMDGEFRCLRWKGADSLLNQRVCRLDYLPDTVCTDYVRFALEWYLGEVWKRTSKTTVKHLSAKALDTMLFALPPYEEQERIATSLNAYYGVKG